MANVWPTTPADRPLSHPFWMQTTAAQIIWGEDS